MKKSLSLIIGILFSANAFALSCPSSKTPKDVAMDMIRAELGGIVLEENAESDCLDQKKFPHLLIQSDFSNDEATKVDAVVKHLEDVKIIKVELTSKETHSYKAIFEVKIKDEKTGIYATTTDKIRFFLYTDKENHKVFGCGGVTEHPSKVMVLKSCLPK
ncbi:MAG: hypothetical protein CME70_17015 [Halobacteriovorax sp.]|nr:hypothetical protein [Halobacteriovorax sp.]